MTITYELDLNSFQAWSGAKEILERIRREGKCAELGTESLKDYGMDIL